MDQIRQLDKCTQNSNACAALLCRLELLQMNAMVPLLAKPAHQTEPEITWVFNVVT